MADFTMSEIDAPVEAPVLKLASNGISTFLPPLTRNNLILGCKTACCADVRVNIGSKPLIATNSLVISIGGPETQEKFA